MTPAETCRTRAAELLLEARKLTERAQRYLRLADQAERDAVHSVDSAAAPIAPEPELDFLSFLTAPEPGRPGGRGRQPRG
jgi:hypothetical protein